MAHQIHRARKRFGQNFLQDDWIIQQIIQAVSPQPEDRVIEIGPGLGALTLPLLQAVSDQGVLTVIELDRDVIPKLQGQAERRGWLKRLEVIQADALTIDLTHIAKHRPLRLVGNLPYNISSPLLFHFAQHRQVIGDIHVMLQKEVVQRICAQPGDKLYGRLSVMLQLDFTAEHLFDVPPESFEPQPKVDSAVVRLVPRTSRLPQQERLAFADLIRQAFSQRRKTLRNTLKGRISAETLTRNQIDPAGRAETLSVADWIRLYQATQSQD